MSVLERCVSRHPVRVSGGEELALKQALINGEVMGMIDNADLRRVLETINSAWTTGETEALRQVFHPEMMIEGPGYQRFATGRDACVESYREFGANAKVLEYKAAEPAITVWADTAVCSYSWTMTWQRTGAPVSDTGTDQFVFARIDGQWVAVYRLVLFAAPAA